MKCRVRDKNCEKQTHYIPFITGRKKPLTLGPFEHNMLFFDSVHKWANKEAEGNDATKIRKSLSFCFVSKYPFTSCLSRQISRVFAIFWIWNIKPFHAWSFLFMVDSAVPPNLLNWCWQVVSAFSGIKSGSRTRKVNFTADFHNCSVIGALHNTKSFPGDSYMSTQIWHYYKEMGDY